jgi:hypothetical protein
MSRNSIGKDSEKRRQAGALQSVGSGFAGLWTATPHRSDETINEFRW